MAEAKEPESLGQPSITTARASTLALLFGRLGCVTGRYPKSCLAVVLTSCWCLGLALWVSEDIVDTDLFGSLMLRPRTRLQREAGWVDKFRDDGYNGGGIYTNVRATRGGKNMLTRKNLLQVANFFADAQINEIKIEHRGITYDMPRMLSLAGVKQPYRFSPLDCFQEGVYDFDGDITVLGPSMNIVVSIINEFMSPFLSDNGRDNGVRVTPYNWCLYLRLGFVYLPSTSFDPHTFGRCRQFLHEDPGEEYKPLERAYDFHRFLAYDYARAAPSTYAPWGCQVTLRDKNRCHPVLSCCEVSRIYAACASCVDFGFEWEDHSSLSNSSISSETFRLLLSDDVTEDSCETLQVLLDVESWQANAMYEAEYAEQPSCSAFSFYPLSTIYSLSIGAVGAQTATSLNTSDCAERQARFNGDDEQLEIVEYAITELYCKMFGGESTCPTSLEGDDFDWRFLEVAVATEEELNSIEGSGRCAHWDGGPDGLRVFDYYIPRQLILGDTSSSHDGYETKAAQNFYALRSYKSIRDELRTVDNLDVSTKEVKEAYDLYVAKMVKVLFGRQGGGSLLFASYGTGRGGGASRQSEKQSVPETLLVILAYAMIIVYTVSIVTVSGDPTNPRRLRLDACLAVVSIVCVFSGLVAGMGLALYCGIKFNYTSVQALPFLVLGLGINDCYVLTHRHLELLAHCNDRVPEGGGAAQVVRVTAEAGASVTITTVGNVVVFVVAATVIRVRVIADFCLMAACALAATYVAIVFGYSGMFAVHTGQVFQTNTKDHAVLVASSSMADDAVPFEHSQSKNWLALDEILTTRRTSGKMSSRRARAGRYAQLIAGKAAHSGEHCSRRFCCDYHCRRPWHSAGGNAPSA